MCSDLNRAFSLILSYMKGEIETTWQQLDVEKDIKMFMKF